MKNTNMQDRFFLHLKQIVKKKKKTHNTITVDWVIQAFQDRKWEHDLVVKIN